MNRRETRIKLVSPSLTYEESFARFYQGFVENDAENSSYYAEGKTHFKAYVQRLTEEAKGKNLRDGYVPCSHYWLLNSNVEILGAIRIRHNIDTEFLSQEAGHIGYDIAPLHRNKGYGQTMLSLALSKARQLGLAKVLITADIDNIASRRVIESNGGEFEGTITGNVFNTPLARYWVNL